MTAHTPEEGIYHLEEGHLCLDFVNTAYIQPDEADPFGYTPTDESLIDLAALGAWGHRVGLLRPADIDVLTEPGDAAARISQLIQLREALRRIIRAHRREQEIPESCLALVNQVIPPMLSRTRLAPHEDGFRTYCLEDGYDTTPDELIDRMLWAIGQSAFSLLTDDEELEMVAECPADDCGYLFRDTSHGRRRWCSMKSCGNRAKVQRFRERHRESA